MDSPTVEYYSATKKNELLIHATTWMNFKNITLSESNQLKKTTHCMILFIQNDQNRQI